MWFSFVLKSYEFISEMLIPKYKPRMHSRAAWFAGAWRPRRRLKSKCSPYKVNEAVFVGGTPLTSLILKL